MSNANHWGNFILYNLYITIEDLSDYENMIDEAQLEPDYYIDRPVSLNSELIFYLAFSHLHT